MDEKTTTLDKQHFEESACTKNLAGIEDALYVLGGKWKLRIIVGIMSGYHRFNELQRVLKGISARVLSTELRDLELNGIIQRKVDAASIPVRITYEATDYAFSVRAVVQTLADWGTAHRERIKEKMKNETVSDL